MSIGASRTGRYLFGAILAAAITLALFALMYVLIAAGDVDIDPEGALRIADIQLGDTRIEVSAPAEKPQRPDDPEQQPPPQIDTPGPQSFKVATGMAVSFKPQADIAIDLGGLSVSDGEYLPIVKVAPIYPRRAQMRGVQGYCIVEYTVTRSGSTTDARAVDCSPKGIFDRASVSAALKFKYKPRVVDGEPVEVPGVKNKFTYTLE